MAKKTHPNIFKGDILRFHFVTGGSLDLAVVLNPHQEKADLSEYILLNISSFITYRTFPFRIKDTIELRKYHNNHLGDNLPVLDISIVGKMKGTIDKLKKLIEEEKQEAKELAPDAIITEYIPILEDTLSALETIQRKRLLIGLNLIDRIPWAVFYENFSTIDALRDFAFNGWSLNLLLKNCWPKECKMVVRFLISTGWSVDYIRKRARSALNRRRYYS